MKARFPSRLVVLCLSLCFTASALTADDPICGKWKFYNNTLRVMHADGTSNQVNLSTDSRWQCMTPQARPGADRAYNILDTKGRVIDRLTLRNADTQLWGMNRKGPFLSATRIEKAPAPAPMPQAPKAPVTTPSSGGRALESIIISHEWLWSEPGSTSSPRSGKVRFVKGGTLQHSWANQPAWSWNLQGDIVTVGPASADDSQRVALTFNVERSDFRGNLPNSTYQIRGLRSDLINGPNRSPDTMPGQSAVPPQPASGSGELTVGYGGMTLGKDWLPRSTSVKRNELEDLTFYASYAVGSSTPGKEPIPEFIVPPFRWLMPLDEAVKALPSGVASVPMRSFQNDCFPQGSLIIRCLQFRYFSDLDGQFNLIYLIADAKQRLVSVQFKSQAKDFPRLLPGTIEALRALHPPWGPPYPPPPDDGFREPSYYDFINEGRPSRGPVSYQLRKSADSSVTLIRTDGKVQWYLPAPLARCLLDIGEHYKKLGLIK